LILNYVGEGKRRGRGGKRGMGTDEKERDGRSVSYTILFVGQRSH